MVWFRCRFLLESAGFYQREKYSIAMPSISQKPLLARLSAYAVGVGLFVSISLASAQTLPDVQRLMKQGQIPQALEKVDAYIATQPKDAQGRFLKGLILTEMGRNAEAITVFTRLTEDFPELPEPYNNLAVLYAQQKQYDKARTALEMAIRTHPSYAVAHENLGDVYAKLASQAYDKALQLDTSNKATQNKLSMIKDLISTAAPATKPAPASPRAESEPKKTVATEPLPAPAKKDEVTMPAPAPAAPPPAETARKPAEKPLEAAPAKPVESKAVDSEKQSGAIEDEVTKLVESWANAWSRKDVRAYLSFYAKDFETPRGMSRKNWEAERRQRIDRPGKLQVSVDDIKVTVSGDTATVRFRQHYTSPSFKSSTGKTLVFIRSGSNKWLIQQERVG